MKPSYPAIASTLAAVLAGAALTVSLTSSGPTGAPGPQGPTGATGKNAELAHLGLCWNLTNVINSGATNWDGALTAPVDTDGVPSCPDGQFVSIVPGG